MKQDGRIQNIRTLIDELTETTRLINREAAQPAWLQFFKTSLALVFAAGVIVTLALSLDFLLRVATSVGWR